jgi:acetylornithine deacetylase/succinyl-diaminopimelate desuccinylase-like protein
MFNAPRGKRAFTAGIILLAGSTLAGCVSTVTPRAIKTETVMKGERPVVLGSTVRANYTPMEAPLARAVVAAVQSTVDYPVVLMPTLGGTLPLIVIEQMLGTQLLTVPIVNADNNQHAENENVQVQFLWDGIETYAALMTML